LASWGETGSLVWIVALFPSGSVSGGSGLAALSEHPVSTPAVRTQAASAPAMERANVYMVI
jgi:hypothetical protein